MKFYKFYTNQRPRWPCNSRQVELNHFLITCLIRSNLSAFIRLIATSLLIKSLEYLADSIAKLFLIDNVTCPSRISFVKYHNELARVSSIDWRETCQNYAGNRIKLLDAAEYRLRTATDTACTHWITAVTTVTIITEQTACVYGCNVNDRRANAYQWIRERDTLIPVAIEKRRGIIINRTCEQDSTSSPRLIVNGISAAMHHANPDSTTSARSKSRYTDTCSTVRRRWGILTIQPLVNEDFQRNFHGIHCRDDLQTCNSIRGRFDIAIIRAESFT